MLVGRNCHALIPGRIYRCAQPSPTDIQHYVAKYGIKTIVNLRGCCPNTEWYDAESRATAKANLAQEDLTLSAGRLPAPYEIRRLVEVLDHAAYPILIHCRRGVDRTGLTSVIAKLLFDNTPLPSARSQLSLRFGHVSLGRTENMLRFFNLYESWLAENKLEAAPATLRRYANSGYTAGPARAGFRITDLPRFQTGQPSAVKVRVVNESAEAWQFRPGTGNGVHLRFFVNDSLGNSMQKGFAGLFRRVVPRGDAVDLTLAIDGLPSGAYTLTADLHEVPDVSFAQLGSEPLVQEFFVP